MKKATSLSKLHSFAFLAVLLFSSTAAMSDEERHIVTAKSDADFAALKEDTVRHGGKIIREIPEIKLLVVTALPAEIDNIAASTHAAGITKDSIRSIVRPGMNSEFFGASQPGQRRPVNTLPDSSKLPFIADPGNILDGLLWNLPRIGAPQAWKETLGTPSVKVAVADTGLDYTHAELNGQVESVIDMHDTGCKVSTGISDSDWASDFGGPANGDWNGHGSWIGGNIAASLDKLGINGIAPKVKLISLKISEWCGGSFDSTLIASFINAADLGIDIVNISFGGYVNRNDPDQNQIYLNYATAVAYARSKGTVIVSSAGNEHMRIGAGGQVLSHSNPGLTGVDLFGLWEVPAGIPGVINVAATGNVVNSASPVCSPDTVAGGTCKPATDAHQPFGVGRKNQLAYYSNYGPRIDIAAPGGARKFNLPSYDRGGTLGFPSTETDGLNVWGDFSITSDWTLGPPLGVPCFFTIPITGFLPAECYSTIQGTSMAAPHVSATLALIASKKPRLRHNPTALVAELKDGVQHISGNRTPPYSATDTSPEDLPPSSPLCDAPLNYCHLGGNPIPDREAYGAGLVNAGDSL